MFIKIQNTIFNANKIVSITLNPPHYNQPRPTIVVRTSLPNGISQETVFAYENEEQANQDFENIQRVLFHD